MFRRQTEADVPKNSSHRFLKIITGVSAMIHVRSGGQVDSGECDKWTQD